MVLYITTTHYPVLPSCDSFLRFIRPDLFQHCGTQTCSYGPFTKWASVPGTTVPAPLANCSSTGQAHVESRNQTAPQSGCPAKIQRRLACKLLAATKISHGDSISTLTGTQTQAERLIRTFNLGTSSDTDNDIDGISIPSNQLFTIGQPGPPTNITSQHKRQAPTAHCSSSSICQNIPTDPRSKPYNVHVHLVRGIEQCSLHTTRAVSARPRQCLPN